MKNWDYYQKHNYPRYHQSIDHKIISFKSQNTNKCFYSNYHVTATTTITTSADRWVKRKEHRCLPATFTRLCMRHETHNANREVLQPNRFKNVLSLHFPVPSLYPSLRSPLPLHTMADHFLAFIRDDSNYICQTGSRHEHYLFRYTK